MSAMGRPARPWPGRLGVLTPIIEVPWVRAASGGRCVEQAARQWELCWEQLLGFTGLRGAKKRFYLEKQQNPDRREQAADGGCQEMGNGVTWHH